MHDCVFKCLLLWLAWADQSNCSYFKLFIAGRVLYGQYWTFNTNYGIVLAAYAGKLGQLKALQNTECVLLSSLQVLACIRIVLDKFAPTLHSYTQLSRSMTHNRTHNVCFYHALRDLRHSGCGLEPHTALSCASCCMMLSTTPLMIVNPVMHSKHTAYADKLELHLCFHYST